MEQLLTSIPGAAAALAVSPSTVKRLVTAGELEKLTIGRRALIPVAAVEAFYVRRMEAADSNDQIRQPDETP